jgi:hypothetical protein
MPQPILAPDAKCVTAEIFGARVNFPCRVTFAKDRLGFDLLDSYCLPPNELANGPEVAVNGVIVVAPSLFKGMVGIAELLRKRAIVGCW